MIRHQGIPNTKADVVGPDASQHDLPVVAQVPLDNNGGLRSPQPGPSAIEGSPRGVAPAEAATPDGAAVPAVDAPADEIADRFGGILSFFEQIDVQFAVDLFDKGGPVVVILFALSVIALTVALVKFWQFARFGVGSGRKADKALAMWISGRRDAAYTSIRSERNPSAFVLAHGMRGVTAGAEERIVREDVERIALAELGKLRSYMRVIEATVQIAPLLGLFGTVIGMISAFQALQTAGSETDPAVLAGGIWVALLTTAVGLAIAIPAAFVNYWLDGRIEREKDHMESVLTSLFTQRVTEVEGSNIAVATGGEVPYAAE